MNDDRAYDQAHPVPPVEESTKRTDRSLIGYTVVALGLALFVRFFIAAPYVVSGASMEPNFHDWEYLIVDRITYDFSEPVRGDVVIFDLPQNSSRALIKRVIGLPGETVTLTDSNVSITNTEHPGGFTLSEPYLRAENLGGSTDQQITLGSGEYFVLGDNRRVSADSRLWGVLPESEIVGRVLLRLYPFNAIDLLPEQARYDQDAPRAQQ